MTWEYGIAVGKRTSNAEMFLNSSIENLGNSKNLLVAFLPKNNRKVCTGDIADCNKRSSKSCPKSCTVSASLNGSIF